MTTLHSVFTLSHPSLRLVDPSKPNVPVQANEVYQTSWGSTIPNSRYTFVNDTHAAFQALQQIYEEQWEEADRQGLPHTSVVVPTERLQRISRLYREALLRQLRQLGNDTPPDEASTVEAMSIVWHLFEVLTLPSEQPLPLVREYLDWLNVSFPAPSVEEGQEISAHDSPAHHPQFWPYLTRCLLRGNFSLVNNLLQCLLSVTGSDSPAQPDDDTSLGLQAVSVAMERVNTIPHRTQQASKTQFYTRWQNWKDECAQWATQCTELPSLMQPLANVFRILSGDAECIRQHANSWLENLGATLLFNKPDVDVNDLPDFLSDEPPLPTEETGSVLDHTLLALIRQDRPTFIRYCSEIDDWLVTHAVDCLDKLGLLDDIDLTINQSVRDFFVYQYGEILMASPALWQVGVDYLASCPDTGLPTIESYLTRLTLHSEQQTRKVLNILRKFKLLEGYRTVCNNVARRHLDHGCYGIAISYYIQANEPRRVAYIADILLQGYMRTGELGYKSVIDNLCMDVQFSDQLQFLSQYRDFHELYKGKQFLDAGKLLVSLLTSNVAPKVFWPTLLVDSIPLLEGDELVFDEQNTKELMRCLEELVVTHLNNPPPLLHPRVSEEFTPNSSDETDRTAILQQLDVVRMALVRNLARALLFQF
ncbi:Nucleoporin nup85 [Dispira simplex]|nr:Nucleoporin nup85 [Dispira simplex]